MNRAKTRAANRTANSGALGEGEAKLQDAAAKTLHAEKAEMEGGDELTPEERRALGEEVTEVEEADDDSAFLAAAPDTEPPKWAIIPPGLKLPVGKTIYFLRIPAEWTDKPSAGDRQCIMWNLTMADEDLALTRARGQQMRVNRELSMVMVRTIDGIAVDNTGKPGPGAIRPWFNDIGPRGRLLVQNIYLRTHQVNTEMKQRFFVDCFAAITSA